ncbi:MAG: FG-GAP-like repeat-containing protein [Acidobacteriaceae bacterium]
MTKFLSLLSGLFLSTLAGFAQTPSFSTHSAPTSTFVRAHGDLNNDGYEDLITVPDGGFGFSVLLSNGDGTYHAPITYTLPSGSFAVLLADFNQDGNLDLIVQNSSGFSLYLGNGDGTFRAPITHTVTSQMETLAAADVNHDNKTDLLLLTTSDGGNTSDLQVLFANGDGSFRNGPTTYGLLGGANTLLTGDFDGDGKADVALESAGEGGTQFEVLSGDGAGNFTTTYTDSSGLQLGFMSADVNGDGISDLISVSFFYSVCCTGEEPYLTVFYGARNRTMRYAQIPTTGCATNNQGGDQIVVADFNGDGIPDIAFPETDCTSSTSPTTMTILSGRGNSQFGTQTPIYSTTDYISSGLLGLRGNRDTKPDLVFGIANPSTRYPSQIVTLLNTTTGNFPTCDAPDAAVGINVCSPTPGGTASSPVNFAIGTAGDTPMRDVEVWADGKKAAEQLTGAFSNYSFLNDSIPLAAGSHRIVVFGVGWDNSLQEKVFTLNVGASSSCSAPSSAGVHVCSPANGSTVPSPVSIQAAGKVNGTLARMELWVDGVKKYTSTTANLDTTLALAKGRHRFAVLAINTAGQKWETVAYATVQ